MKNLTRTQMRKEAKRFQPGDRVTWGTKVYSNLVVEVAETGLWVDVTGMDRAEMWGHQRGDMRVYFVRFDGNVASSRCGKGPIELVSRETKA